jgi:thiol:disulfide interchange protein DsbC
VKKLIIAVMALGLMASYAQADEASLKKVKDMELIKGTLVPAGIEIVNASDMGNLYEVIVQQGKQKGVLYTTKDGKYLVQGALIDAKGANITKARFEELNNVDFSRVSLNDAIIIKKGTGVKKLIMVTDVDCPFCIKAYDWLKTKDNYTLYVYLMPIPQLHPKAYDKSVKVLCAKDTLAALDLAKADKDIPAEKCADGEAKLKKQMEIGGELGAQGTPLFIMEDGTKVVGFAQQALEDYLKK